MVSARIHGSRFGANNERSIGKVAREIAAADLGPTAEHNRRANATRRQTWLHSEFNRNLKFVETTFVTQSRKWHVQVKVAAAAVASSWNFPRLRSRARIPRRIGCPRFFTKDQAKCPVRFKMTKPDKDSSSIYLGIAMLTRAAVSSMENSTIADLVIGACILIALVFVAFWLLDHD